MATKARQEMEANIQRDYPELNPFILRNLMDIYFAEDGKSRLDAIVKNAVKKERKNPKQAKQPPPTEYITNIEVRKWEDTDFDARIKVAKDSVFKIISNDSVETPDEHLPQCDISDCV